MSDAAEAHASDLVGRLRAAGCVFAEDEAAVLLERAGQDAELLERLAERRIAGEPLEPLVGWVDFGALRLSVGPGAFVPRQRTLELAARAVDEVRARQEDAPHPVFVEAFAGVAPVASSVRSAVPGARVVAAEAEATALGFAAQNLRAGPPGSSGEATAGGEVCVADVLDGLPLELRGGVDVIAAVPPYVPSAELDLMPREAREHEPTAALTGGEDGLRWIRALIEQSPAWLRPGGCLLIELHVGQRGAAVEHARAFDLATDASGMPGTSDSADEDIPRAHQQQAEANEHERQTVVLALTADRTAET